jgi:hypothetical protein
MAVPFFKRQLARPGQEARSKVVGSSFLAPEFAAKKILKGVLVKKIRKIRKRLAYSSM